MKRFTIWSLISTVLLMACSAPETMSELDRVEKAFGDQIGGDVDPLHLWRTAVTLKVNVESEEPVQIWAMSSGQSEVTLYDMATLKGSGTATLTLPQGVEEQIELLVVTERDKVIQKVNYTGETEQFIDVILSSSISGTRSASDPSLYGSSALQNEYYTEVSREKWNDIMRWVSQESVDQKPKGEIVNYELVSRGRFECYFLSGFAASNESHILGYYYHSPYTYEDIVFVPVSETHIYDYLDGKAKIQYQLDNIDIWYDANYDMNDGPDDDSKANFQRRGDDAYSIVLIWQKYGERVTKIRGLTFVVDVPVGMHLGFYLQMRQQTKPAQYAKLTQLGLPAERIPSPYTAYNFSAQMFNDSEGTNKPLHRSWIHEMNDYSFMGMEDIFTGGDVDCNDVTFGVEASGWDMVMPEIIEPDIDYMLGEHITLPWTIGYEDVHRNADYDFNDAVIRLEPDFDNDQIDVQVLAAGSDQKMWLHYDGPNGDINLGEIHQLLDRRINDDATELPFINTKSSLMNYPGVSVGKLPWPKEYTMAKDAERFYIEVKRGTCTDCTDIIKLPSQPGLTPEAVLVAGEWKWPKEGISITETYSVFPDWCADMTRTVFWPWHNYPKNNTFVSNGL